MKKKTTKAKNPQDVTLRNNRARQKEIINVALSLAGTTAELNNTVGVMIKLTDRVLDLEKRVTTLEQSRTLNVTGTTRLTGPT